MNDLEKKARKDIFKKREINLYYHQQINKGVVACTKCGHEFETIKKVNDTANCKKCRTKLYIKKSAVVNTSIIHEYKGKLYLSDWNLEKNAGTTRKCAVIENGVLYTRFLSLNLGGRLCASGADKWKTRTSKKWRWNCGINWEGEFMEFSQILYKYIDPYKIEQTKKEQAQERTLKEHFNKHIFKRINKNNPWFDKKIAYDIYKRYNVNSFLARNCDWWKIEKLVKLSMNNGYGPTNKFVEYAIMDNYNILDLFNKHELNFIFEVYSLMDLSYLRTLEEVRKCSVQLLNAYEKKVKNTRNNHIIAKKTMQAKVDKVNYRDIKFTLITNKKTLKSNGLKLEQCINGYDEKIIEDKCILYEIKKGKKLVGTLELKKGNKIGQYYGLDNEKFKEPIYKKALYKFCKKTGAEINKKMI